MSKKNRHNSWGKPQTQQNPARSGAEQGVSFASKSELSISPAGVSAERCLDFSIQQSPSHRAGVDRPSDKRAAANRANAQKSTGPRTEAGRAAS